MMLRIGRYFLGGALYACLCGFFFIFPIPKSDERRVTEMVAARNWHGVVNFTTERLSGHRNGTNDTMLNFRCLAHLNLNQLDDAERDCQDSLKAVPDKHLPTNNLGVIRLKRGLNTEAVPFFEKAVQLKPDFCIGWANLVATRSAMGEPGKAWDAYQQLAKVDASRARTYKTNFRVPDERPAERGAPIPIPGQMVAATTVPVAARTQSTPAPAGEGELLDAQKLVVTEPANAAAWQALGGMYAARGDAERALRAYGEAIKLQPSNPDLLEAAGALHAKQGQKDRVKEIWEALGKIDQARAEKFFSAYLLP